MCAFGQHLGKLDSFPKTTKRCHSVCEMPSKESGFASITMHGDSVNKYDRVGSNVEDRSAAKSV
jgi:hypothetical protein